MSRAAIPGIIAEIEEEIRELEKQAEEQAERWKLKEGLYEDALREYEKAREELGWKIEDARTTISTLERFVK